MMKYTKPELEKVEFTTEIVAAEAGDKEISNEDLGENFD